VLKLFKYKILAILLLAPSFGLCQNLVPNWSFEENNDSCTNLGAPGFFENLDLWLPKRELQGISHSNATFGTPDYYSSCFANPADRPPNNNFGFQYPYDLNSFAGIGIDTSATWGREAIRIELMEPLKENTCYHGEFYCNLHNNSGFVFNKLGMCLTVDSFAMLVDGSLPFPSPQIFTNSYLTDTANWVKVEGDFLATGGEKWLTIGWLFDISQISYDIIVGGTGLSFSYYNIDAVKLYPCTDDEEAVILPNFISPNGDGKNDFYVIDSLPPNTKVTFFNRWGNQLYSHDNYQNDWNGNYMGKLLPTGTYFVVVEMPHGTRKSTFIELVY
jgi:gliding motility-associated-like protein